MIDLRVGVAPPFLGLIEMDIFEKPFFDAPVLTSSRGSMGVQHTNLSNDQAFIIDILGRSSDLERTLYHAGQLLGRNDKAASNWHHIKFVSYLGETPVKDVLDFNGLIHATLEDMVPNVLKCSGRCRVMVKSTLRVNPALFRQYLLFYTGYWDTALLGV